jgi:uncharacterized protein (DUF4415 family)
MNEQKRVLHRACGTPSMRRAQVTLRLYRDVLDFL